MVYVFIRFSRAFTFLPSLVRSVDGLGLAAAVLNFRLGGPYLRLSSGISYFDFRATVWAKYLSDGDSDSGALDPTGYRQTRCAFLGEPGACGCSSLRRLPWPLWHCRDPRRSLGGFPSDERCNVVSTIELRVRMPRVCRRLGA